MRSPSGPAWPAWLAWLSCAVSLVLMTVSVWLRVLSGNHAPAEPWVWLETTVLGLAVAGIPLVGALIASRLPANPYGWLWCALGVVVGVFGFAGPASEQVGWPRWVATLVENVSFAILLPLLVAAVLLFPTGRVPGPRWRWLERALVAVPVPLVLAAPFSSDPDDPAGRTPWALQGAAGEDLSFAVEAWAVGMFTLGLPAVWALLLRHRSAGPVERRQLTWFLYAALLAVSLLVLNSLELLPGPLSSVVVLAVSLALFPAAVVVAVLRYRLYEIDRIVSRTVSYTVLTGALVGLYLVLVALLRPLLEPVTGSSALAVAGSTLAVAAVFDPARRRLQEAVDRRFDRARYDAARAVDAFAARLRDQVDLDEVTAGLRDTVAATVAPGRTGVWLRAPARSRGRAP